jgi:hypothetical protein
MVRKRDSAGPARDALPGLAASFSYRSAIRRTTMSDAPAALRVHAVTTDDNVAAMAE